MPPPPLSPDASEPCPRGLRILLLVWLGFVVLLLALIAFIIGHYVWTGDLLGFLPAGWRASLERGLDLSAPPAGEGRTWQLRYHSLGAPWVWGLAVAGIVALTVAGYFIGHATLSWPLRVALAASRLAVFGLLLGVMLPEWSLSIQNHAYPPVIVAIDDSLSMQVGDTGAGGPTRLEAARRHLAEMVAELLSNHRHTVRLYSVGEGVRFLGAFHPGDEAKARAAVQAVQAAGRASRQGSGLRQLIDEGRPGPLILYTDGVVTDGESLRQAAAYARSRRFPLFFVGVGNPGGLRALRLHDLMVSDTVFVRDTLVFEARLTAEGYGEKDEVKVWLLEKGREQPLAVRAVPLDPRGLPVQVRLEHRPTETGEKTFILEALPPEGDAGGLPARLERPVSVLPVKKMKILYVEGYPRYEYRSLKWLLETQTDPATREKLFEPHVLLLDADPGFDESARPDMPPAAELATFDVILWGDVNPDRLRREDLANVRDFVRVRGGGFLMIAGEHCAPQAYRHTPLADILPVELIEPRPGLSVLLPGAPERHPEPYHLILLPGTRLGMMLGADGEPTAEPWWWSADGYRARQEADVLAVHPYRPARDTADHAADHRQPLVLDWLPGAGRSMFFGFDETWRWRSLDGEAHYTRFWLHTLRYLAHVRQGRVTLSLDRQTPYRRGESLRLLVRFPDEMRNLPDVDRVVVVQHTAPGQPAPAGGQPYPLQRVPETQNLYELRLDHLQEGSYRFWLSSPVVAPRPSVTCEVLGPPGERDRLLMDQDEMQAAAAASGGRFYLLGSADRLLDDLPAGKEVLLGPVRELTLWDHPLIWGLVLALLVSEWLVRRWAGVV
jgi:hypothetical protein